MAIDWANFTPWTALGGGLLIGLAATMFLLFNGRIAGVSGIVGGLFRPRWGDVGWRIAFVLGLLLAPAIFSLFSPLPEVQIEAGTAVLIAAGLLVGIGTRYGSGCTSGHGVCGMSRRSPRSLAATAAFMCSGFATVYVARHVVG